MSQTPIPMDRRLLGAVKRALRRMPAVPYDLTQVKVLDNFYSPVDPYWENVPEWFAPTPGDFSAIGRMERLRQLSVVLSSRDQILDMGDFSWLPECKHLQHLDLAQTSFSDCALLLRLPALKTVRLPRREQLTHLEALDALPQSVKVQMGLTPYPSAPETFRVPPPPKPKPEPSEKARAIVDELKRRTETPCWKLTLRPEGPQGLLDSKVGGLPYWDPALTLEQIQALELPTHVEADLCTPVIREAALTAEKTVGYMGPGNFPFDALFREAVRAVTGEDIGDKHEYQYFNDADRDYLYDQLSAAGHRLLGYPCFTQCDPRKPDGPYDTLLFQLDSDMTEDREDLVLWGDCGVGNFFINREDLLRRDFSRVLYNWDCS